MMTLFTTKVATSWRRNQNRCKPRQDLDRDNAMISDERDSLEDW